MPIVTLRKNELWRVIKAGLFVLDITKTTSTVAGSLWLKWDGPLRLEISFDQDGNLVSHPDEKTPEEPEPEKPYEVGGWRDPELITEKTQ